MTELTTLLKTLRGDPVMQAMFEAEGEAHSNVQLKLLDAVLMDDAGTVRELLDEEDQTRLLGDGFFLPLSVLLVCKAAPKVLAAFQAHGYDCTTKPNQRASAGEISLGDMALNLCEVDRQKELIECGFLQARKFAFQGMASADPLLFDLWQAAYFEHEATQKKPATPAADLYIFRWLPDTERRQETPIASDTRKEYNRRLQSMIARFLDFHYPGSSQERWDAFLEKIPSANQSRGPAESTLFIKELVDYQLIRAPELRKQMIDLTIGAKPIATPQKAHLVSALLKSGFTLAQFQSDMVVAVLGNITATLRGRHNPPDAITHLWEVVKSCLRAEDPARLESLPQEVVGAGASLKLARAFKTDDELDAFCDTLDMCAATPARPLKVARARL